MTSLRNIGGKPTLFFNKIKILICFQTTQNVPEELPGMAERFQKMKERRAHDRNVYGGRGGYRGNREGGRGGNRGRGGFRGDRGGRRDRW